LIVLGILMGYIVNLVFIKDPDNAGFISASCAFTAMLQLPLMLMFTLSDLMYVITPNISISRDEAAMR
jgi:hypothetical protein